MKSHYIYIKVGRLVRITDEYKSSKTGKWYTFRDYYGSAWEVLGYDKNGLYRKTTSTVPVRRKICTD